MLFFFFRNLKNQEQKTGKWNSILESVLQCLQCALLHDIIFPETRTCVPQPTTIALCFVINILLATSDAQTT